MSFSCKQASLAEMLGLASKLGYDAIEPRCEADHGHGIELALDADGRQAVREQAKEAGVCLCALACSSKLSVPEGQDQTVERTGAFIDLCADVGAPSLRVFGGHFPEAVSREIAIDTLVDSLSRLAFHASERGVSLVLETHDAWSDPEHVAAAMERVNHPNVKVNWDPMHPLRFFGWDIDAQWRRLGPWVGHCHTHDGLISGEKLQMTWMGEGEIDHAPVIRTLRDAGFTGYLSVEYPTDEPAEPLLEHEIRTMRGYEGSHA